MDWNSDGRHDLLVGDTEGKVLVFLNTNTDSHPILSGGKYVLAAGIDIDVGERATPVTADWNSDGKKDLLAGSMDGSIRVFLNEGSDSEPVLRFPYLLQEGGRDFSLGSRSAPRIFDWDGDGLRDILAGEMEGHVYLLLNTGTGDAPVFKRAGKLFLRDGNVIRYPDQEGNSRSRLFIADWNNDGRNDLLLGGKDGRVILFKSASGPSNSPLDIGKRTWNQIKETTLSLKKFLRKQAGIYFKKFFSKAG
ncbi:MAG: VCBS repeat-containing protein [Nitrospirota bacterium]